MLPISKDLYNFVKIGKKTEDTLDKGSQLDYQEKIDRRNGQDEKHLKMWLLRYGCPFSPPGELGQAVILYM